MRPISSSPLEITNRVCKNTILFGASLLRSETFLKSPISTPFFVTCDGNSPKGKLELAPELHRGNVATQ